MATFGPVHKLIVRDAGSFSDRHSLDEFPDYEIEHSPECENWYSADHESLMWGCAVGENEREGGLRWYLNRSANRITEPGEYLIQAWAETIRGYDFTEYDGGICRVD